MRIPKTESNTLPGGRTDLQCPDCGAPMVLRRTEKRTYPNGQPRLFYGCSAFPKCNTVHGAHPNGEPLGKPANKRTRKWRAMAHSSFDNLWILGYMSRGAAYRWLQETMKLSQEEAHVGMFSIRQCKKLHKEVESYLKSKPFLGVGGSPQGEDAQLLWDAEVWEGFLALPWTDLEDVGYFEFFSDEGHKD